MCHYGVMQPAMSRGTSRVKTPRESESDLSRLIDLLDVRIILVVHPEPAEGMLVLGSVRQQHPRGLSSCRSTCFSADSVALRSTIRPHVDALGLSRPHQPCQF